MGLPTGEVCFLFSDIEGSTRLARAMGADAWATLLRAHDRIVDDAVADGGGLVVGHEGDGAFAVFPGPAGAAGAVDAAIAIQGGVMALATGDPRPSVRIGLHRGDGRPTEDGSYVGLDVHYASRVSAAANGRQILLSAAVAQQLGDRLPAGTELIDEGFRRLKDFDEPRRLYRLVVPVVADDDRPLRTVDLPTNLPESLTTFVGRDADIEFALAALGRSRLVTLTGPGGTGKTRLAIGTAIAARPQFPDGTWMVDLAPVRDAGLVPSAIGATLGVRETPEEPVQERLKDYLHDRQLLLLLDNLEQLLPGGAVVVADLLGAAAHCRVIATSRVALRVTGEQEYPVPPLDRDAAVGLFVQRALLVRPGFDPAPVMPTIVAIVDRLGGLPLAVELAAARMRLFGPDAILERLGRSLDLLAGGALDLPERQRTLRAAIGWSVDLLSESERRLFRRLGVFAGSWSAETTPPIVDDEGDLGLDPLGGLEALVDRSLLQIETGTDGEPRFLWHPLMREYALEDLDAAGERAAIQRRHALTFLAFAERVATELLGTKSLVWLARVEDAQHDLRAAMRWSLDVGEPAIGLRIVYAIWRSFQQNSRLREGREWTNELLEHPGAAGPSVERMLGLAAAGGLAYWSQDAAGARVAYRQRLEIAAQLGDPAMLAEAHYDIGFVEMMDRNADGLRSHEEEALRLYEQLGDANGAVRARQGLVLVGILTGDLISARDRERENLRDFRASNQSYRIADSLTLLSTIELQTGDPNRARALAREGLTIVGPNRLAGPTVGAMGSISLIDLRAGDRERGARLAGAAAAIAERAQVTNALVEVLHMPDPVAVARETLGPAAEALLTEGAALTTEQAVEMALQATEG